MVDAQVSMPFTQVYDKGLVHDCAIEPKVTSLRHI